MEDKKSSVEIKDGTSSNSKTEWYSYGDPPRRVEVRATVSVMFTYDASTGIIADSGTPRFSYSVVNAASHEGITATMTSATIDYANEHKTAIHLVGYAVKYEGNTVATSSIEVTCSAPAI